MSHWPPRRSAAAGHSRAGASFGATGLWGWLLLAMLLGAAYAQPSDDARRSIPGPAPQRGVYYEIFVRSFQDSDGDGIGDLRGIIDRLAYLEDLGISGIWLTPIHPSPSYHGYDVTDYRAIHPDFGTMADFDRLVREAGERGIAIVLDLVVNHTSSEHPWFESARSGDPELRDWYVWQSDPAPASGIGGGPAWHPAGDAHYLGLFWSGMPDLNHRNEAVTDEMKDVARFWLERGVAGFRIDAIQYIVEDGDTYANSQANLDWVADFNAFVRIVAPGAFLVGETWTQTPTIVRYHDTARLDMSFNFPLYDAVRTAVVGRTADPLSAMLAQDARLYPEHAAYGTFLGNHDHIRAATVLSPLIRNQARLALAAGFLLTLPGTPFLYYGEEIGMPNGPGSEDPAKRTPMRWEPGPSAGFSDGTPWQAFSTDDPVISVASQWDEPGSLLETYRRLIALRRAHPALDVGATEVLDAQVSGVVAFVRTFAGDRVAVFANVSGRDAVIDLETLGLVPGASLEGAAPVDGSLSLGSLEIAVVSVE